MPQLAADAVRPAEDFSVKDDAAADARSERDEHDRAAAHAAAAPIFAQRGAVRVVPGAHGQSRQRTELLMDVEDAPIQVDAAVHDALGVHRAGHADADAQQLILGKAACRADLPHRLGNIRQDRLALVLGARRQLPLHEQRAVLVKKAQLDRCSADIGAKSVFQSSVPLPE